MCSQRVTVVSSNTHDYTSHLIWVIGTTVWLPVPVENNDTWLFLIQSAHSGMFKGRRTYLSRHSKVAESEHPSPGLFWVFILWSLLFTEHFKVLSPALWTHFQFSQATHKSSFMFHADVGFPNPWHSLFLAILLLQVLLDIPKLICQQPEPKSHDYPRTSPTALK